MAGTHPQACTHMMTRHFQNEFHDFKRSWENILSCHQKQTEFGLGLGDQAVTPGLGAPETDDPKQSQGSTLGTRRHTFQGGWRASLRNAQRIERALGSCSDLLRWAWCGWTGSWGTGQGPGFWASDKEQMGVQFGGGDGWTFHTQGDRQGKADGRKEI